MQFANMRQLLAYAADNFGLHLLESGEFRERVGRALTFTGCWEQRSCALKAPLMVWFVFSMVLHRSMSIAALVKQMVSVQVVDA